MKLVVNLVLDIGKSNVKLSAIEAATGELLESLKTPNSVQNSSPYPHAPIDDIWQWYCTGLKALAARYHITYLSCTTHGATAVCLSQGKVALPVADYEAASYEQCNLDYETVRPDYCETLSPALSHGLNVGRQLFWLAQTYPKEFSQVDTILLYPQYWGWLLSGRAVSEVTSLGCHTDLWNPQTHSFSSLVTRLDWSALFPPLLAAGAVLGTLKPELATSLGLPADCLVMNGIHDSNASLVPYLKSVASPFTVISSGTWIVIAGIGSPLEAMVEADDMLANVNAWGQPVPCIRFMGGREWSILADAAECDLADLHVVLEAEVYHLPAFSDQGGPFREYQGQTIGAIKILTARQKTALASLYCALVTDYCLSRIHSQGTIYLEGSFASNQVFCTVLQALRPEQTLQPSFDQTGTTQGVVQLIQTTTPIKLPATLIPALSNKTERQALLTYQQIWLALTNGLLNRSQ